MKTNKFKSTLLIVLGGIILLLGLMSLLSIPNAENHNQFIGLSLITIGGIGLGYYLFKIGMTTETKIEVTMRKPVLTFSAVELERTYSKMNMHQDYIDKLSLIRSESQNIATDILDEVIAYHYEQLGDYQELLKAKDKHINTFNKGMNRDIPDNKIDKEDYKRFDNY